MDLLRQARVREADRRATLDAGLPTRVLMENAGRALALATLEVASGAAARGVLILCGRGGNGGDGLVLLRALHQRGIPARAFLLASEERLGPETRANLETARALDLPVELHPDLPDAELEKALPEGGVLADALLGGGARGPLEGTLARVVERLRNPQGRFHIAVDLPTGLDPDSGRIPGPSFRAHLTFALAAGRRCHFLHPASELCGKVRILEIGIPPEYLTPETGDRVRLVSRTDFRETFPAPPEGAHKSTRGRLLLVAGSKRMPGAAVLAARGALGAGIGLLTVAATESILDQMPPEAMRLPLPEGAEGELGDGAADIVCGFRSDAITLGSGIGRTKEAEGQIRAIVSRSEVPLVLDADGLNAFASRPGELRPGLALTPHPGEAARLLGRTTEAVAEARLETARELAATAGNPVALKGPGTVIAEPDGAAWINSTGGPELATGGTGDVLSGIVGALLARGYSPTEALAGGTFLHGRAGEIARERLGPEAVTASAIAGEIGNALIWTREAAKP